MKIYDKTIYKQSENIKTAIITITIFILGFVTGFLVVNEQLKIENTELQKQNQEKQEHIVELEKMLEEKQVKINEQFIEIDALKETVYMLEMYGK